MIIKAINDAKLIKVSVKPLQRLADSIRQSLWSLVATSETPLYISPLQGVNFKTVQWTVLKEGTLWQKASPKIKTIKFCAIFKFAHL